MPRGCGIPHAREIFSPTTLLTRFAKELRRAPGAGDFGLEKGLLTPRTRSPDAGRGADAERKGIQGVKGESFCGKWGEGFGGRALFQ